MEPMNCTALVDNGKVEIWMPNQAPIIVQFLAARAADVDMDDVTVHTTFLGGGFGRRVEGDLAVQAVTAALAFPGRAVKLLWSREQDIQHDMYRPAAMSRFVATLDAGGRPLTWYNRIAGQVPTKSITQRIFPFVSLDMPDNTSSEGSADMPYAVPNILVEHTPLTLPVPVGFWRSVGHSYNAFFTECFMDELAHAAGKDPYAYRRELLDGHADYLAVLDRAAQEAEWGGNLGPGRGKGIALHESFGSIVAQVAEITMLDETAVQVDRVVCVVDCGRVINPDTVVAQIQSGVIYGLTAALFGEITLKDGAVEQSNFPDYAMLRLGQAPLIEVHLAPSGRPIGGIGEVATPPIAPALANAIFNATGKRLRGLPISKSGFSV
jgi:isoquinoline 1-oxidoreductase beta subunit